MSHVVIGRDLPEDQDPVSRQVAEEVYPLAVRQARTQVLIQAAIVTALIAAGVVMKFPRSWAFAAAMIATGIVAVVIDVRWWLWVRRADPVDAYRLLQIRDESHVSGVRSPMTIFIQIVVITLWLTAAR
jgi:hypothetical protein